MKKSVFTPDAEDMSFVTGTEKMTVNDKKKLLERIGREDMIHLFNDYRPRQRAAKRAPLDQRVSITVTDLEKIQIENEMRAIKKSDGRITMSQYLRNKAIGNIDVVGWADLAEKCLSELDEIEEALPELKKREKILQLLIEETDDREEEIAYLAESNEIQKKMGKLVAVVERRPNRLSGRMTMVEAETIKWRAQRLCISTADYLRFKLFDLSPGSIADAHMSLIARRRFYISVLDVAENGFGNPPQIVECTQCGVYLDTIAKLQERIRQLETFS